MDALPRLPTDPENAEPVPYHFDGASCPTCMFWTPDPPAGAPAGRRMRCPLRPEAEPMESEFTQIFERLACTLPRPARIEEGIKYVPRRTFGNEED